MSTRKVIGWLHLWLGLLSGAVVFVIGITGACYAFVDEIGALTEPYQRAPVREQPYMLPSRLKAIAGQALPGKHVGYISYERGKAAYLGLYGEGYSLGLYVDPYTGRQLHVKDFSHGTDFFSFVLRGHTSLWLPGRIGRTVIDYSVLVFFVLLVTGMVLWWPRNWRKANRDKSLRIKWSGSRKRRNYDLHNVLGFYAAAVLLVIALTGLVWAFDWFGKAVYWMTSGGKARPEFVQPVSDTTMAGLFRPTAVDSLWLVYTHGETAIASSVSFPDKKDDAIEIGINHRPGTYYKQDIYRFDQYTLKPLKGGGSFAGRYRDAGIADRISRMNYDIHVGAILGFPGKVLAFCAALVCASLPVTGFYIWWGRKRKAKGRRQPVLDRSQRQGPDLPAVI